MLTPETKAAITRATTWLRANPDKHIKAALATDEHGMAVLPTNPNATCFCAAGRVLKEMDRNFSNSLMVKGLSYPAIWGRNDGHGSDCEVDEQRYKQGLGQVCALDYLDGLVRDEAE